MADLPARRRIVYCIYLPLTFLILTSLCIAIGSSDPDGVRSLQNTLLKLTKSFSEPPHTTALYEALQVLPNATSVEITKQYRRLSRVYHPDKRRGGEEDNDNKLENVRRAYEVLKDDGSRLLYHKFGLASYGDDEKRNEVSKGSSASHYACLLLTGVLTGDAGTKNTDVEDIEAQRQLLRLMGYDMNTRSQPEDLRRQRVTFIAADLVERIRPLVEGILTEEQIAHDVSIQCDLLKRLPLGKSKIDDFGFFIHLRFHLKHLIYIFTGSQIIRCIGRAYRHAGQRVLNRYRRLQNHPQILPVAAVVSGSLDLSDSVHQKLRKAKDLLTAAVASGKLVISEQSNKRRNGKSSNYRVPTISDQIKGDIVDDFCHSDSEMFSECELNEIEREKAEAAMIEALQIEALWKISKIDLDRTISESCELILNGKYFFFPSRQSSKRTNRHRLDDGWVGSTGETIDVEVGRIRAAAALVLIGDTLVKCSKESTSWKR